MVHPLASGDPEIWNRVVTAANPASLLVAIGYRMGPELRRRLAPDDVWQDTLLRAWQARAEFEWQGTPSFRRWLLAIAENLIQNHRQRERAQKRDVARTTSLAANGTASDDALPRGAAAEPWGSTTPSRIAIARERAHAMEQALLSLPADVQEVVRLRLFDELLIGEIASRIGLGESAVRHRFRRGAELYRARLRVLLAATDGEDGAPASDAGTPP